MSARLTCQLTPASRTTALIDAFERRDESGAPLYASLLRENCFAIRGNALLSISLILERWDWRDRFINERMTFTRVKKEIAFRTFSASGPVPTLVGLVMNAQEMDGVYFFSRPYLLHAQASVNRTGLAGRPGARYGETIPYMFTGAHVKLENR